MVEKKKKEFDYIRVTQVKSSIGSNLKQKKTLKGLGLDKLRRERVLENTDSIRGMVSIVKHLVKFEFLSKRGLVK